MTKIYFDESGQTGTHLFDPQQPYFVLVSTDLSDADSREILTCGAREQPSDHAHRRVDLAIVRAFRPRLD